MLRSLLKGLMRISTKLFFWFLVVTLVPVFIVGLVVVIFSQNQFSERIANDLTTIAVIQEQRLDDVINLYLDTHTLLSSDLEMAALTKSLVESPAGGQTAARSALNERLLHMHRSTNISRALSVVNLNGEVVGSTSLDFIGKLRPGVLAGNEGQNRSIVSDIGPADRSSLTIRVIGPIRFDGEIVGVLEMTTIAEPITNIASNFTGLGDTGETLLAQATEEGDALLLTPTRFDPQAGMKRTVSHLAADVPVTAALQRQERVFVHDAKDYRGVPVIAASRYYEPLNWGLVVKIDAAEAFRPIREIEYFFWYAILASVLIALFFSYEVSNELGKPLNELTTAAEKIEGGDYSARSVGTTRTDEIGLLATAFNEMAERVEVSHEGLESKVRERTSALKQNLQLVNHLRAVADAILSSIGDAVIATDDKDCISFTNTSFERLFGMRHEDVIGKPIRDMLDVRTESGAEDPSFFRNVYAKRSQVWSGTLYFTRGEETFPAHLTLSPVSLSGVLIGHVLVLRDVTEEKAIERAKTEFVSIASHQLRTPLSAINWYVELLNDQKSGKLTKKQQEYSQTIHESSRRMTDLVNALLNVSRIEMGRISIEPKPQHVERILENTFKELKPQITEKQLYADIDIQKRLPKIPVDENLIRIVFQNLLSNAIKYTPEHGSVHARIVRVNAGTKVKGRRIGEASLLITVSDNGYGIPKDQQEKIFGKLFRADNVMTKAIEGTGLGLYVSKSIIDHSKGLIWFESEEDKGTTFYVTIPLTGMPERAGVKTLIA